MTYNQLKYFVSVAESLSITRTAELFHVSQPAVSFAIRELEKEYSIVFFERHHNELFLTPQGRVVYQEAKKLIHHFDTFDSNLREMHIRRTLQFAVAPNISAAHLPGLYSHIKDHFPETTLEVQELSIAQMTHMLKNGELDAALFSCYDEKKDPNLCYTRVSSLSLKLYASPKLFFCNSDIVNPSELDGIPLVLQYRDSHMNSIIHNLLEINLAKPQIIFCANQLFSIMEFISKDLAAGFLPSEITLGNTDIRKYTVSGLDTPLPLYFVFKKGNQFSGELKKWVVSYFEEKKI